MMINAMRWITDKVRIHPVTVGNDAYHMVEEAMDNVKKRKKNTSIEVVETPEMDISDCAGTHGDAKAKVYLIKCRDGVWDAIRAEMKLIASKSDTPYADMGIV